MGYTAGTLDLSILGADAGAISTIDKTVKSLNSLSRAINKFNNVQTIPALTRLENVFNRIAKVTANIDTTALEKLSIAASSLNSISKISKLETLNWDKVSDGFSKLTVAVTPFVNKVKEAETSLNSLYGILNKTSNKKARELLDGKNKGGGFNSFFKAISLTTVIYAARRLGNIVGEIAQKGADYTETLNLWEVSMGNNISLATEFVNKMNQAYGISEKTLMNAQAIFKNMLGSLGQISDEMAYSLSESVTQMAVDYASLYNVTFEQAFTKFQAALAGQVRPIRSVSGYDITENTLFQLYQQLGGTKTMRQLSRTEKQLLAIYAVFQQMGKSGAVGDLGKTIESFANQSRVMAESWQRVLTYTGTLITHLVEEAGWLTYINAMLIFMGDVLKGAADSSGAIKSYGDAFEAMADGIEKTNDEMDELNNKLLGFDKFRSLQGNEDENELAIDQEVLNALQQYSSVLDGITTKAHELAQVFKTDSGLFDKSGAFNVEKWQELGDTISTIGTVILAVFAGGAVVGAISKFTALFTALKTVILGPVGIILGVITALYVVSEDFRLVINGVLETLFDLIGQILTPLMSVLPQIMHLITPFVHGVLVVLLVGLEFLVKLLSSVLYLLDALFNWSWESLGDKLGSLWSNWASIEPMMSLNKYADNYFADGGLPDKGSMFVAGEAGAEIVYNMPSGQSGVANIQQIAQATYSGTMRALNDWWGGRNAKEDIPQLTEANPTGMYQAVTGVARAQGKVWSKA
jgi:hypothetical protein